MNKLFIQCECGNEVLLVEKDEKEVYLAMYKYHPEKRNLKHKLRMIWNILRNKYWSDQIVISEEDAQEIKKFL